MVGFTHAGCWHLSLSKSVSNDVQNTVEGQFGEKPVSPMLHLLHHNVKIFKLVAFAMRLEVGEQLFKSVNAACSHDPIIVQLWDWLSDPARVHVKSADSIVCQRQWSISLKKTSYTVFFFFSPPSPPAPVTSRFASPASRSKV